MNCPGSARLAPLLVMLLLCLFSGCGATPSEPEASPVPPSGEPSAQGESPDPSPLPSPPALPVLPVLYPAEDAERVGGVRLTGSGALEGFENDGDMCVFTVGVPQPGFYDLIFRSLSIGGYKENVVLVNGEQVGLLVTDSPELDDSVLPRVYMEAGEHTVGLLKYWGWIRLESLTVSPSPVLDASIYDVSARLSNTNAGDGAKRLMSYLADHYGKVILAGQQSDGGLFGSESAAIHSQTGKYPAVIGLDLMGYSPSRAERGDTRISVEPAIEAWENGAIVTLCWHWNAPTKYLVDEGDWLWWRGFYTQAVRGLDLAAIMDGRDAEGLELLISDIDAIAVQLKRLQDAGVPALWRPLHEASGGWFWWGASGPDAYIKLWNLMYERLTEAHGLNNLIWVWNGQHADWYPGGETVDLIGEDIYPGERVYTSQAAKFLEAAAYTSPPKMAVLSESGFLPDPDLCMRDGAMWGFAIPWTGEFVSERYIEKEMLLHFYHHDLVVTLDELPDLTAYPIRD
ncbi:MAG: beta-mannosidase [Oscillospiraceae bacterium]|nr:beta-mannosidase [Oscillospiraceae bacterium]